MSAIICPITKLTSLVISGLYQEILRYSC